MKILVSVVIILGITVAVLWPFKIQPYLEMKQMQEAAKKEEALQVEKFRQEYERMSVLAAEAHEKCPTKPTLYSNSIPAYNRFGFGRIPAYPHLSDIYLHILPPMARVGQKNISQSQTGKAMGYQYAPLTEDHIREFRGRINKKRTVHRQPEWEFKTTPAEFLAQIQKESLTPTIINILQETLAYCTANQGVPPKKVKLVDTPFHEHLEQEDALTIVIGAVYYTESLPHEVTDNISLQTSQYIPRWKVFPLRYVAPRTLSVYGFLELKDDPFHFSEISARNFLALPSKPPITPKDIEEYRWRWFGDHINNNIFMHYKVIERRGRSKSETQPLRKPSKSEKTIMVH